jgi:hypothetical protein
MAHCGQSKIGKASIQFNKHHRNRLANHSSTGFTKIKPMADAEQSHEMATAGGLSEQFAA